MDGYRHLNCFLISDAILGSNQRGCTLEISFALELQGGVSYGETSFHFNIDEYYDRNDLEHKLIQIKTNDLTSIDRLPWLGGRNSSHFTNSHNGTIDKSLCFQ